ncbi:ABC transporter ATP-binding protein [Thermoproteota archaeon]
MPGMSELMDNLRRFFFPSDAYPIRAKKVRFAYAEKEILKDFNLSVRTSQIVAVVGMSGSGKSTFLNLVAGVLTATHKGKISILGRGKGLAKEDIGYVPQEMAVLPDLSIEENIRFFGNLNGISSDKALKAGKELMGIMQLNVPLDRKTDEISGGQRVRLNIMVSLLHNPHVIIMDEPFVGLDYHNRKLLWHFLEHQRNRHKTVILTTHMLTEAEHHSDRIVLLHQGKIFAKGKMKDIRTKLQTHFILELKLSYLNKGNVAAISRYCKDKGISIMDSFNNYMMFSVKSEGQRGYLLKFLDKKGLEFKEIGFREPNLDELFLKVRDV